MIDLSRSSHPNHLQKVVLSDESQSVLVTEPFGWYKSLAKNCPTRPFSSSSLWTGRMDWAHCIGTGVGSGSGCCMLTVLQSTRRLPLLALSNTSCKNIFDIGPHFSVNWKKKSTLYTASTMALLGNIVTTFSDPAATLEITKKARTKKFHIPLQGHWRHEPPYQRCQTLPQ